MSDTAVKGKPIRGTHDVYDWRGSPADRKARKLKILGALPIRRGPKLDWGGDGTHVPCAHGCGTMLDYVTLQVDRIDPHGRYVLTNVQASCARCNNARGHSTAWRYNPDRDAWGPNSRVTQ